ncbi:MAG TPA: tetratricopeptide repeat protein [Sedimentisphaerales bacterium]|nr:tetratricopeptide repeat protein [Sedimentisphaerales bacterium]
MKKTLFVTICCLILRAVAPASGSEPLANEGKNGLYAKSVEQVLRLPPEEVDLATAALIVSEQWSDLVPGRRHIETLDDMAIEIRQRLKDKRLKLDYQAIPVINEYLFDELAYKPLKEADDPNDLFLHTVLDKGKGYCLSLSVLYLSLGERLGLPLYGVVVPGHFFVRYDDGRVRFNIETTSKGGSASDQHYIEKFNVPQEDRDGIYMKNLNKIQTLGCFFNNLGLSYNKVGNTESELLALVRAAEINPTLSEARTNLGNVFVRQGEYDAAIREYEAALAVSPENAKAHNNLGNAYSGRGWILRAISEYRRALELDPRFIDAHRNLAIAYAKQKNYAQALSQLNAAVELEPKNAETYLLLGDVYAQAGRCEQAIAQYKKSLKFTPGSPPGGSAEAYYGMAVCYGQLEQAANEIAAYNTALSIKPNMLNALVNLGNAYFGQQKYDSAIELFERAVAVEPTKAMIYFNLGAAYSNKGDYAQAVGAFLNAVQIDDAIAEVHYQLAVGYYNLQDFDLAWKHIKIAQKLGAKVTDEQLEAIKSRMK